MLLPLVQWLMLTSCKPIPLAYAKGILNAHTKYNTPRFTRHIKCSIAIPNIISSTSHLTHLTPHTPLNAQAPHTFSDSALMSVFFGLLYIIYKGELNDTKAYRGNYIQHSVSIYMCDYVIT